MKLSIKIGIGFAVLWMLFSLTLLGLGISREGFTVGIFTNVFFLLCAIALGLYLSRRKDGFQETIGLDDFKTAMQSGIIYTVFIALFVYAYHEYIDTSIRDYLYEDAMSKAIAAVPDTETFEQLQAEDSTWKRKSYDDYIENAQDKANTFGASAFVAMMHLAGLVFFSFFYSFFVTLVLRKIVLR
ncbi:MAG: DUF4199 domain-containing protein [Crocinitomicaceae bacterium]|nr:DUF4199 domain-containing protein [Crocinitomicaceae bacterium]